MVQVHRWRTEEAEDCDLTGAEAASLAGLALEWG